MVWLVCRQQVCPGGRARRRWWSLAVLVLFAGAAVAQPLPSRDHFTHEQWTTAEGLPVNTLTDLLQTHDGYLWIATRDGLARFDGARFTVFNRSNTPGLPSNRLMELRESRDGLLWVQTEQYQLFALRDGQALTFGPEDGLDGFEVRWIYADEEGTLYAGTERGLYAWMGERFESRWTYTPEDSAYAGGFTPLHIKRDSRGALWVGTEENGLLRLYEGRATAWTRIDGRPLASIIAVTEDARGRVWVQASRWTSGLRGPYATGFFVLEGDRFRPVTFGRYCDPKGLPAGASLLPGAPSQCLMTYAGLYVVGHPPDGSPFKTDWSLAFHFVPDDEGHRWFEYMQYLYRDDGLTLRVDDAEIVAFSRDHEGSLWVATNGGGLHRFKPAPFETIGSPEGLPIDNVYSIVADRDGALWAAWVHLGDGLYRLGPNGPAHYTDGLPNLRVSALYEDRRGTLWVGTEWGPCRMRLDPAAGAPPEAACRPLDLGLHFPEPTYAIHEDAEGGLWFGGDQKLLRYDATAPAGEAWRAFTDGFNPAHRLLRSVAETPDGTLWFGAAVGGLTAFVPDTTVPDGYRRYRLTTDDGLPSNVIRDLYADPEGYLWVVTQDAGLARLDLRGAATPGAARIARIQQRDGLPDDALHTLRADALGQFWISSNRGLIRVDRAALNAFADGRAAIFAATAYTERDGLRNREFNGGFFRASSMGPDGRLWFASQAGAVVVDPARIRRNAAPPPVVVEALRSQNEAYPVASRAAAPLTLPVGRRSFEVDYTALSFLAPKNVRFRYRLEGFDGAWVEAGNRRTAYYTGVPPGTYTFLVVASNNDGVWNEKGARLQVYVAPYFYETTWFIGLSLLALAGLVAGAFGWRVQQLRTKQRLLESEVEARTRQLEARTRQLESEKQRTEEALTTVADQAEQLRNLDAAKSRFFANLSHEFRTPLTLIIGPLDDVLDHEDAPPSRRDLRQMQRNARRLLSLINQLLDLARLDAGGFVLHVRRHDLVAFLHRCTALFESMALLKGLTLDVQADAETLVFGYDEEKLEKVILNLIANALKFTPRGGRVSLHCRALPEHGVVVAVRDTGVGIPADQLPYVFDRFYQAGARTGHSASGSGIGLALAKELVELHGGTIAVESEEGRGTTFTIALPNLTSSSSPDVPVDQPATGAQDLLQPSEADSDAAAWLSGDDGSDDALEAADRPLVLVVEDNPDLRTYLRRHLAGLFQVEEVADGRAGLERALAIVPDLVLSDVMMPVMDGYALCAALKQDPRTSHVPVVLLTARADAESLLEGLELGADDYLPKPFHAEELRVRLRNLIEQRERLRTRFRQEAFVPEADGLTLPVHEVAFLSRAREVVQAHVSDPDFGVDALAEATHMSRRQLTRKLSALVGEAPGALIRRVRLEHAAELLRREGMTVKVVADAVGYRSVSHFTNAFRDVYGVPPATFAGQTA